MTESELRPMGSVAAVQTGCGGESDVQFLMNVQISENLQLMGWIFLNIGIFIFESY